MLSYIIVAAVFLVVGAVFGVLWGRKHPASADAIAQAADSAKQKL